MRRILLVRHGQTALNVARIVQGPRVDPPLSEAGRAQAHALAKRLAPEPLAAIYASPMLRARETAEAVARIHALPVRILAGLTEYDWGVYCGRKEEAETAAAMGSVFRRWWAGDLDARPPDGESAREAAARVRVAFAAALAETPEGSTVALFAHGRINKILLADLLASDLTRQEDYPQHNTGLTLLEGEGNPAPSSWKALAVNDTRHRWGVDLPEGGKADEKNA